MEQCRSTLNSAGKTLPEQTSLPGGNKNDSPKEGLKNEVESPLEPIDINWIDKLSEDSITNSADKAKKKIPKTKGQKGEPKENKFRGNPTYPIHIWGVKNKYEYLKTSSIDSKPK